MTVPKITVPIFSSAPDAQTESLNRHLPPSGIFLPPTNLSPTPAALSEPLSSMEPSKTSPVPKPSKYAFNWHFLAGALISILILVWLLGVLWGFVVLILGMMGIIRLRWSSHLVTDNRLIEALRVSRARLNYRGSVLLLISDRIALPITWGWLQAKIALPQDVLSWPAERIDAALLHELAHIKRRDFTVQTLSRVTCSFHWYNPLVVRLFRVWKSEAEQACDDLVLRSGYSGERYSNILLEVWRSATIPRPQSSLGLAMVRTSTLEQRVIAILDPEKEREEVSPRKHMQLLVIFGSITLVVAVLGLTRPTNYHLTPELQTDMQGIQRQIQNEANAHVALQIHLEREQEYWSGAKGRFEPQPEATAADISLDLIGTKALYRAVYRPLVSRWIQGPAPYFVENTRIDASDGNQTVTILSDPKLNRIGQTKWRSNGDIGLLAGFGYRADAQSGSAIDGVEGKGLMPFNGSRYGIEKTILNGVSVIRLQDIITLGGAQRRTWWFDPQRDYALIQYELADFNNGLSQPSYSEMTTVQGLQKVADGVWYPTKFTTQSLRSVNGQLTDDSYRSTTTITSLATLPSIDPATFQVTSAAVNLPEQIPSTPTAQEIYDAMFQRYAKCSTFSCTGNYDQHSDGLFGITDHRMFSIRYARPSKIRIEWTQPSSWWSNSDTSTIYTESGKIFSKFDFQPTVESEKSIGDATSEAAGVSGTISYLLPSLLMGKSGYLDHWTLKRRVDEEVAGDDCYVIEVETKGFGYYIFDVRKNDNAILRAIDIVETNAAETQRTQAHKNNSAWLNGSDPTKSMIWFTRTTEFHDIAFNQPLKDETFLHNATSMSNAQPPPQTAGTMPLTQISRPQGKVINPNGEAGANAKVSLVSAGRVMTITDGRIDSEIESIFSASDGGFTLNQQAGVGDLLVVIDEEGYAAIPWEKFSGTITLIPWAKVSGTAFLGTAPAAQKAIALLMLIPPPPRSQTEGQVRFLSWATVDSQGAFAADHVPVGIIDTMLSDTPTLDQHVY
jgi:beta-lactamase regulating signal transducer with metallopeptidase domain/outer membrane lipoprotein-sorting protein